MREKARLTSVLIPAGGNDDDVDGLACRRRPGLDTDVNDAGFRALGDTERNSVVNVDVVVVVGVV